MRNTNGASNIICFIVAENTVAGVSGWLGIHRRQALRPTQHQQQLANKPSNRKLSKIVRARENQRTIHHANHNQNQPRIRDNKRVPKTAPFRHFDETTA